MGWLPFQTLDQPYKIASALRAGAAAYVAIALSHAFSAFGAWISHIRRDTLLFGYDQSAVLTANLLVGALALGLWALTSRHPSRPLMYLALAWSVIELAPPLTYWIYGHGAGYYISVFGLLISLAGVQGARARARRSDTDGA